MALRMGDWKLFVKKGVPHLYNLATDIHEDKDVAKENIEIVKKMIEIIHREHKPSTHFIVTLPSIDKIKNN